jgi:enolase-phosphatase E1
VLTDIEGTTTPLAFVKQTLFPYILDNIDQFLEKNWDEQECQKHVTAIAELLEVEATREKIALGVKELVREDRKVGPLKALQGYMWREAYEQGLVKGQVYDDVLDALKEWEAKRILVSVYSSGSVEAQKLLFKYSDQGDLLSVDALTSTFRAILTPLSAQNWRLPATKKSRKSLKWMRSR